jgi:hypothetical protein
MTQRRRFGFKARLIRLCDHTEVSWLRSNADTEVTKPSVELLDLTGSDGPTSTLLEKL